MPRKPTEPFDVIIAVRDQRQVLWSSNMTASERGSEIFVDIWADEVRRLAPEVASLRQKHVRDSRAADYGEEWSPTEHDLYENFRRLWAAQHHLVWAAYQLERWAARLSTECGKQPPEPDPVLADLRNALEHLDEAIIDGEHDVAVAGSDLRFNRSLRRLPGSQLLIGTGGSNLFGLVDSAELERRALSIVTTTDRLMEEAEDWIAEYGWPDVPDDEDYGV